jgi:aspartyl/asparaginyl beta-hydroxylase (cupin superfamily)
MDMLLVIAIIIILLIILLMIGEHDPPGFYETKEIYPELLSMENPETLATIVEELNQITNPANKDKWKEWPEKKLWGSKKEHHWSVFPFYGFESWTTCASLCPKTTELLRKITGLRTAAFSKLGAGTVLDKHQGWGDLSNYVLRNHLLLTKHDAGKCTITVCNKTQEHEYGKWLTFDDSLPHSAANNSKQDRYVLLIDIDRPSSIKKGNSKVPMSDEVLKFAEAMQITVPNQETQK